MDHSFHIVRMTRLWKDNTEGSHLSITKHPSLIPYNHTFTLTLPGMISESRVKNKPENIKYGLKLIIIIMTVKYLLNKHY